jgi:hypothetical protein
VSFLDVSAAKVLAAAAADAAETAKEEKKETPTPQFSAAPDFPPRRAAQLPRHRHNTGPIRAFCPRARAPRTSTIACPRRAAQTKGGSKRDAR